MNRYKRALLLVVALLALTAWSTSAQDDFTPEEEALVEYVATAIEDTLAQSSISATVDVEMLMDMAFAGGTIDLTMEMTAEGEIKNAIDEEQNVSSAAEITMEISIDVPDVSTQEGSVDITLIQLGSEGYARFSNVTGMFADALPQTDWIRLDMDNPVDTMVDIDSLLAYRDIGLQYPVTVETVVTIEELEPESLDGRDMRAFEMTFDIPAIMEMGEEMLADLLGTSGLGEDDVLLEALAENMTLNLALWVGTDDGLVYYAKPTMTIETELTAEQTGSLPADLVLEMVQEITYSDFGEPVEISAPDM